MKLSIWFDGSCVPMNPGKHTVGAFVLKDSFGNVLKKDFKKETHVNFTSNNYAEWKGFELALDFLMSLKETPKEIKVYGDSLIVVNQLLGKYKVKKEKLYTKIAERTLKKLNESGFKNKMTFSWIPREQNSEADELTKAFEEEGIYSAY